MAEDSDPKTVDERSPSPGSPSHRLAHFELLEEIGRGGMGVVYRARDSRLGRQVAIKLLPVAFAGDPSRRSRFLREARAAAQLNHPNIATLYEVGEAEWTPPPEAAGGREGESEEELSEAQTELAPRRVIFLAMEYVQGQDLGPRLEGDGLTLKETLSYGIQISEALAAAHAAGVIHRDLKPQNLRITPEGRIKILDFGLAKLVQEGTVVDEPLLTAHGAIVGTAPYMAPEQLQGASEVDSRCDLFSFGVVLYQMLTGRLPFEAPRLVDYVKALTHQTPEPPSRSNPEVSPQLEQVVERLLAKEPEDRYGSALEVGDALKAIARGGSIKPPPSKTRPGDSIFGEVLQPFRRPWVGWAVGVVFLVVLLAVILWTREPSGPEVSHVAVLPFENRTDEPALDAYYEGLSSALIRKLAKVPGLNVESELDSRRYRGTTKGVTEIARELAVGTVIQGAVEGGGEQIQVVVQVLGSTGMLIWDGEIEGGREDLLELQARLVDAVVRHLPISVSDRQRRRLRQDPTVSKQALDLYFRGDAALERADDPGSGTRAEALFRRALDLDRGFAWAWAGLARSLEERWTQEREPALLEEAAEAAERAVSLQPDVPDLRIVQARIARHRGRYGEAEETVRRALEINPDLAVAHRELAQILQERGDIETAETAYRWAVELRPGSWRDWNHLGAFFWETGRYEQAEQAFVRAAELSPEDVIRPRENLGTLALVQDRTSEAIRIFEEIPANLRTASLATNLGAHYFFQGDYEAAAESFGQATEIQPAEPLHWLNLGDAQEALGDFQAAAESWQRAAALATTQAADNPGNLRIGVLKALALAKTGACEPALAEADRLGAKTAPQPELFLYLAKALGVCEAREETLEAVRVLIEAGMSTERLQGEPEIAWLFEDPELRGNLP